MGKKEMAYALACLLYCPNNGCLECEVCQTILEGKHLNVEYIGVEQSKTMISKEQIASLQEEFSKTSLIEGSRVYIIDGIDTASVAAQNSLLKFIEDPINSAQTIGIFLAKDTSNVVPTILSRCALQYFDAYPLEKRVEQVMEQNIELLDAILSCCLTNNVLEAKEIAEDSEFIREKELFLKFIDLRNSKEAVLFYLDNVAFFDSERKISVLLKWTLLFLEDTNRVLDSKDSLILQPLYDKIKMYSVDFKTKIKDKIHLILNLFQKLQYNVIVKNVFHELIVNWI